MSKELWVPCPEYEEFYDISNTGLLRSKRVFVENDGLFGETKGFFKDGKIKKQFVNRYGYLVAKFCKHGKCRVLTVHRMVAKAFIPNPDNLSQVNHIDGNKQHNVVENLEWVSPAQNTQHAWDTGLINKDTHGNFKLTQEIADEIREKLKAGGTVKEISKEYNIHISTVYSIKNNKTWITQENKE